MAADILMSVDELRYESSRRSALSLLLSSSALSFHLLSRGWGCEEAEMQEWVFTRCNTNLSCTCKESAVLAIATIALF